MNICTDFLVIGSGIAGLSYALNIANKFPQKQIIVLTKTDKSESNTKYAQGGIAAVLDKKHDSFESHIADTLKAGDRLCDKEIVEVVIEEGPTRIEELMGLGATFDRDSLGKLDLIKEGGHSAYRIAHYKDITGFEIQRALLKKVSLRPNIQIYPNHLVISLIVPCDSIKKICYGVYTFDNERKKTLELRASCTMIASGGIGQVYQKTTNPLVATGDGIAMAYRAGSKIEHMEFIQFHPTVLYNPKECTPAFLISEALRGFGAILKNSQKETFMYKYSTNRELASRDIVSRAIYQEIKKVKTPYVLLDCRHFNIVDFETRFPSIYKKCLSIGIDPKKEMIPVTPAAHYLCGGIKTDSFGQTNIKNLYACGECACTGLHGANRLASNSLLEALVFSYRACQNISEKNLTNNFIKEISSPDWISFCEETKEKRAFIKKTKMRIQEKMDKYTGIIRTERELKKMLLHIGEAERFINEIYPKNFISRSLCELRNIVLTARLIVTQSLERVENRGVFYKIEGEYT